MLTLSAEMLRKSYLKISLHIDWYTPRMTSNFVGKLTSDITEITAVSSFVLSNYCLKIFEHHCVQGYKILRGKRFATKNADGSLPVYVSLGNIKFFIL